MSSRTSGKRRGVVERFGSYLQSGQRTKTGDVLAIVVAASAVMNLPYIAELILSIVSVASDSLSTFPPLDLLTIIVCLVLQCCYSLTLVMVWLSNKYVGVLLARYVCRVSLIAAVVSLLAAFAVDGIKLSMGMTVFQIFLIVSYQLINDPTLSMDKHVSNPLTWWRDRRVRQHNLRTGETETLTPSIVVAGAAADDDMGDVARPPLPTRIGDIPGYLIDRIKTWLGGTAYIPLNVFNIFWIFVVASIVGLIVEMVYCLLVSGVWISRVGLIWGPFSPLYGIGGVLFTLLLNRIWNKPAFIIFIVSAVAGAAVEYMASWYLEVVFGIASWDYSGNFMNFDGRTDLGHAIAWGVLGLLWIRFLLPGIMGIIGAIPLRLRAVITIIGIALMLVDISVTVAALDVWSERVAAASVGIEYIPNDTLDALINEVFDDELMSERFANMRFLFSSD